MKLSNFTLMQWVLMGIAVGMVAIGLNSYFKSPAKNPDSCEPGEKHKLPDAIPGFGEYGSTHVHADFKVVINGKILNFSDEKYAEESRPPAFAHLHDNDGDVMHKHALNVTFSYFMKASTGFILNDSCIVDDRNIQYCSHSANQLKMKVNHREVESIQAYSPRDLDRILLIYGVYTGDEISSFENAMTNKSCIYSEKCPERKNEVTGRESCS